MVRKSAVFAAKLLILFTLNAPRIASGNKNVENFNFFEHFKENHPEDFKRSKKEAIEKFMKNIAMVESSGGKNTKHKVLNYGLHKGHRAIGKYGLMPYTIIEIIKRKKSLKHYKYLKIDNIYKFLEKDKESYQEIAMYLAEMLYEKYRGHERKMAYCWNYGHNINPDFFEKNNLYKKTDYVTKFSFYKLTAR